MEITIKELGLSRKDISFFEPPKCECGSEDCDGEVSVLLDSEENLISMLVSFTEAIDCPKCVGVAFKLDGEAIIAIKEKEKILSCENEYMVHTLVDIVEDLEIHHMMILNQIGKKEYDVIH